MPTGSIAIPQRELRLLLVEDYEPDAFLLQRHLQRSGYTVSMRRIETREEMADALVAGEWDVVIADYTLPSFGARDALAMVQASGLQLPFLIVSGTIDEESAVSAMRAGAHDYVLKGNLERLIPAIEREVADAAQRRERLRTHEMLQNLEKRFSATFNQAAVGMAHVSFEGDVILANLRLCSMLGYTEQELLRLNLFEIIRRQESDDDLNPERLLDRSIPSFSVERQMRRNDGRQLDVQLTVSLLQNEPGVAESLLLVVEDISAKKAADRERQELMQRLINSERLASAGRMANTLAHEINNPLEALTNIFYLLQIREDVPPSAQELVVVAARELERIGHITRSTLSFYRKTPGKGLGVLTMLNEVVQLFQSRLNQNKVELVTEYGDGLDEAIFDLSLRQVFANLIGNALEAMPQGGKIRVRAQRRRDRVVVTVADTGVGIPKANYIQIFEPFFTTKGERGTGLGLWVTRGIIEELGGSLGMRSSTDPQRHGTVLSVSLPWRSIFLQ